MRRCDPRFEYVSRLGGLAVDQVRESNLGTRYRVLAIERSGYVICRRWRRTVRLWCDVLESMQEVPE